MPTLLWFKDLCWELKEISKRRMGSWASVLLVLRSFILGWEWESGSFFENITHTEEHLLSVDQYVHSARWFHNFLVSGVLLSCRATGIFHLQDGGWEQWMASHAAFKGHAIEERLMAENSHELFLS